MTSREIELMTAVRTHRAKLSQVHLNYAEAGARDAPMIFLLQGWAETWREWSLVIPALAGRYRVIAPDLRGLGNSSRPDTGYDTLSVVSDIIELAHHLGVSRFKLVGHDIGAMTAYALASHWRDRVEKLVVLDIVLPGFSLEKAVHLGPAGWGVWHFVFHASPVGSASVGTMVEEEMKLVASDVTGAVAPESGHWIPEEQPERLTARLLDFLGA